MPTDSGRTHKSGPIERVGVRRELAIFYGVAAIALIVVSIGAVIASRTVTKEQALKDAERTTSRLANLAIGPLLKAALGGSLAQGQELRRAVANRMSDGYLLQIDVWDSTGTLVYADDENEVGRQVAVPDEVTAAINTEKISSAFEDHPEILDGKLKLTGQGFVEVYVPLHMDGHPVYAFEAYYDYARVNQSATLLLQQVVPLVLLPLLALQFIQVPIAASLARRVRRHESERSALLHNALAVSETERIRIAADLHDGPIQDLAGIGYALDAVAPSVPEHYSGLMQSIQSTVRQANESLRRLMVDLYPPDLSADRLPETITNLTVPLRDHGIDVCVNVEPLPELDSEAVTTLYRVAREALANVAEHAQADRVEVSLRLDEANGHLPQMINLTITDNGVGLDPERIDRRAEGHLGLRLLADRVENMGGSLSLTAPPHGGTRVSVLLPLALGLTVAGTRQR